MENNNTKNNKTFLKIGLLSAFIASLCCLGPLIFIALGIGTAGSFLWFGYNKPYFLLGALVFLLLLFGFIFAKSKRLAVTVKKTLIKKLFFGFLLLLAL